MVSKVRIFNFCVTVSVKHIQYKLQYTHNTHVSRCHMPCMYSRYYTFNDAQCPNITQIEANFAFDMYREQYFEGGISSCYFWDQDNGGFAGFSSVFCQIVCLPWPCLIVSVSQIVSQSRKMYYRVIVHVVCTVFCIE